MQKIQRDSSGAPAELVRLLEDNHVGLRQLEVQQLRGRAGYCTIPGEAYAFRTVDDGIVEVGQRPASSVDEIARAVWSVAKDTKRRVGGDQRFALRCIVALSVDKKPEVVTLKFDVGVDDVLGDSTLASPADAEGNARATFTHEIVAYAGSIHGLLAKQAAEWGAMFAAQLDARTKADLALASRQETTINRMMDLVDRALALRVEAGEAEIAAAVREAKGKQSEAWRETGKNLLDVVRSPVGVAAAAQLLGLKPEDAAKLMEAFGPPQAASDAESPSIRKPLEQLYKSLTMSQRTQLLVSIGAALTHLQAAKDTTDEAACRAAIVAFFDALGDENSPQWNAIESTLTEEQRGLVLVLMDRITEPAPEPAAD